MMHAHVHGTCLLSKSILHDQVHTAWLSPCCMIKSILHDQVHTVWSSPYCMIKSILRVQARSAYPCSGFKSMSKLSVSAVDVHVHAAYPCPSCPCPRWMSNSMSMLHAYLLPTCPCPRYMSVFMYILKIRSMMHVSVHIHATCPWLCPNFSSSMLHVPVHVPAASCAAHVHGAYLDVYPYVNTVYLLYM